MKAKNEKQVMLRDGHQWKGRVKEGSKKVNMGDVLSIQE
jgi:hypothetical protein